MVTLIRMLFFKKQQKSQVLNFLILIPLSGSCSPPGVKYVLAKMVQGKEMLSCMYQQEPTGYDLGRVNNRAELGGRRKIQEQAYHLAAELSPGPRVPGQALCSGTVSLSLGVTHSPCLALSFTS